MAWPSRTWLLVASVAFAVTAVAAGVLLYYEPTGESVARIALALALSLLCLNLATRGPGTGLAAPSAGGALGCPSCGARRDAELTFCARCGA